MFNRFSRNMNSRVDTNIYLLVIIALSVLVCYLQPKLIIPALIVVGVTYYFARRNFINKEIFFSSYLDNIIRNIERTNHFAVRKLDIGMAVFFNNGLANATLRASAPRRFYPCSPTPLRC